MIAGKQSIKFDNNVYIKAGATVAGTKEKKGPLGCCFDVVSQDDLFGGESWEEAESRIQSLAFEKLLEQTEANAMWDRIPMVRIDGKLYYDTGRESIMDARCGTMDGEITSTVDGTEIPTEDNQSNFGSGFGYQYGADDTIEIYMNEKWFVFEYREESE